MKEEMLAYLVKRVLLVTLEDLALKDCKVLEV